MDELVWDAAEGGWFSTTGKDPSVLLRLKDDYDGAEPAASSVAALNTLTLAHLTAAPVTVGQVAQEGFGRPFTQTRDGAPAAYDMQTRHAKEFGGVGAYQYGVRETLLAVRAYAQSEPLATKPKTAVA